MRISWSVLAISLVLWAVRAAEFALLDRYAPLVFLVTGLAVLGWGLFKKVESWRKAVRVWGSLITLIGLARFGLALALTFGPEVSQHGVESLTPAFFAASAFHLFGGLWVIIRPPMPADRTAASSIF